MSFTPLSRPFAIHDSNRRLGLRQTNVNALPPRQRYQGCIKLLRSMRQGWVPISFSETNPRESALPFVAEGERQNFRRHFHPFSLSLAFVPRFTVNLNRLHGMRSSASQFQLSRTPLAALGLPWGYPGTNLDLPWYHRSMAGASSLSCCGTLHLSPPAIVNPTLPCQFCQSRSVKPNKAPGRAGGQPPALPGGSAESNGKTSRKPAPACANPSLMQPCQRYPPILFPLASPELPSRSRF